MTKVLIIGAGGVATVAAHKCAQNSDVFNEIIIASRTKSKCDALAKAIGKSNVATDEVDADNVPQLVALFKKHRPDLVINLALPYQDLSIMDACLECGISYMDTANYERATKQNTNTAGNGPTRTVSKKPASQPFSGADSTRA